MNNPDEETAVAQFGGDDKYFGVATLMCTMPGLPMFGHGQVEGFHEKYGMEYRRPKWDEHPNEGLVGRHEREIFPLMKKRYLFSGVADFAFYDFVAEGGGVDEDVFAYSNAAGDERALVLYNNKYKDTRGRIDGSIPSRRDDGSTVSRRIADALGMSTARGEWMLFRDASKGLEYVRPMKEIAGGFYWELGAFKYHVLHEFRGVNATAERPYDRLAAELSGRGVPSIARALVELRFRPVHQPLREAVGKGHVDYLLGAWDAKTRAPTKQGVAALEERIGHVADGLSYLRGGGAGPLPGKEAALARLGERYARVLKMVHAQDEDPKAIHETRLPPDGVAGEILLAWAEVEAVIDLIAELDPATPRHEIVGKWELGLALTEAFGGGWEAEKRAAMVLLEATLPALPVREAMKAALQDARGRALLGVHEANGVVWLGKEAFDELAQLIAYRDAVEGRASVAMADREAEDAKKVAAREGYKAEAIAKALDVGVKVAPPTTTTGTTATTAKKSEKPAKPSS
jgi:hypothetical protein